MDKGFGNAIAESVAVTLIFLLALVFGLGMLTMWGMPKLWAWLMPIIHAATA